MHTCAFMHRCCSLIDPQQWLAVWKISVRFAVKHFTNEVTRISTWSASAMIDVACPKCNSNRAVVCAPHRETRTSAASSRCYDYLRGRIRLALRFYVKSRRIVGANSVSSKSVRRDASHFAVDHRRRSASLMKTCKLQTLRGPASRFREDQSGLGPRIVVRRNRERRQTKTIMKMNVCQNG